MSSDSIGPKLLGLLGISIERCKKAIITIESGKIVIVNAEYYASMNINADTGKLETEMRKYSLIEK